MIVSDYEKIVGKEIIHELQLISLKLKKKKIQCINSTKTGGGVAEILSRLIPLLNDLEIDATWDVIKAEADYFNVTKAFHNSSKCVNFSAWSMVSRRIFGKLRK